VKAKGRQGMVQNGKGTTEPQNRVQARQVNAVVCVIASAVRLR